MSYLQGGTYIEGSGYGDPLLWPGPPQAFVAGTSAIETITGTGVTAGTFTASYAGGPASAAIAFNATAAQVATAVQAVLPAGWTVAGAGGPLNTTPVTLTFGGAGANQPVALLALTPTGVAGGTITDAMTTPGVLPIPAALAGRAPVGARLTDSTTGTQYANTGTQAAPVWTAIVVP